MAKDDVERPARPPRKRKELERALPAWLASWAADEGLPEPDRRRAQAERDRRKKIEGALVVGLVIGPEGATPEQVAVMREYTSTVRVTKVMAPMSVKLNLPPNTFVLERELREIVKTADVLFAAVRKGPKPNPPVGVWQEVRHARLIGVPTTVVLPDGEVQR